MTLSRLMTVAATLAVVVAPTVAGAQSRSLPLDSTGSAAPESHQAEFVTPGNRIAPPSLDWCRQAGVLCVTTLSAVRLRPSGNPPASVPANPQKRTRILRGALIGGLAGLVLIGLYGTVKEGLCDAAKCPSAGHFALFGTLGGAGLGALIGAADP